MKEPQKEPPGVVLRCCEQNIGGQGERVVCTKTQNLLMHRKKPGDTTFLLPRSDSNTRDINVNVCAPANTTWKKLYVTFPLTTIGQPNMRREAEAATIIFYVWCWPDSANRFGIGHTVKRGSFATMLNFLRETN